MVVSVLDEWPFSPFSPSETEVYRWIYQPELCQETNSLFDEEGINEESGRDLVSWIPGWVGGE